MSFVCVETAEARVEMVVLGPPHPPTPQEKKVSRVNKRVSSGSRGRVSHLSVSWLTLEGEQKFKYFAVKCGFPTKPQ